MINWFREKLSEKRTRWRKQQSPAVSDSRDGPHTSNAEKKQKLYTKNSSDDSILPKLSLKVINPRGGICTICVGLEASGLEMKKEALRKLSDSNSWSHFSLDDESSDILDKYKLIRAKTSKTLDDRDRVDEMRITENEEFVLVAGRTDQMRIVSGEIQKGPSESEILDATKDIPVQFVRNTPVHQINSAFMQTELQYDFRKILTALLKYSAVIIGGSSGSEKNNQADRLIKYYRQKLKMPVLPEPDEVDPTAKKKANIEALLQIIQICSQSSNNDASQETVQNMVDMGFDEERVQQALRMTKNEAEACDFLLSTANGFTDLPIIETLLSQPQIQFMLGNPKIFIAYISILENYWSLNSYLNDNEFSANVTQILRIYHEEKHILAINQSNAEPT